MTVVIGYSAKSYAILAADTRMFYGIGLDNGSTDDFCKIRDLKDISSISECMSKICEVGVILDTSFNLEKHYIKDHINNLVR